MYNDRRYSLARYSLSRDDNTAAFAARFSEKLSAVAGMAVPVPVQGRYMENWRSTTQGAVAVRAVLNTAVELGQAARVSANVFVAAVLADTAALPASVSADILLHESLSDTLDAQAWASVNIFTGWALAGALRACTKMCANEVVGAALSELFTAPVHMHANEITAARLFSMLHTGAYGQKNTPAALPTADCLNASPWGSKDLTAVLSEGDTLSAAVFGSKDIYSQSTASAALSSILAATSQTTETAIFQLTIPPGGELRIDSDVFTVLLNGQNALHTQSGDWIEVSRELLRLLIESAAGGKLEGQLIYTERFL